MDRAPGTTILALVGPTGVGKTEVAVGLAERFPVSLISLDSAMVYRGMDIGTAKPEPEVLGRFPHSLVDILDPVEAYSAARFLVDADAAVREALEAGRIPLLVGGTMLYLKTFREGLAPMPPADPVVRARLSDEARSHGRVALYERLRRLDPVAAAGIHPHNFSRVQRALEVQELTGRPISALWGDRQGVLERHGVRLREFAIEPGSRQALHARLEARLDIMLASGFVEEVAVLRARGDLQPDLPAMRAVGYRQIWDHLDGRTEASEMRDRVLAATRQLAKRQLTWLRGWDHLARLSWAAPEPLIGQMAGKMQDIRPVS